jgi:hypothetical protein
MSPFQHRAPPRRGASTAAYAMFASLTYILGRRVLWFLAAKLFDEMLEIASLQEDVARAVTGELQRFEPALAVKREPVQSLNSYKAATTSATNLRNNITAFSSVGNDSILPSLQQIIDEHKKFMGYLADLQKDIYSTIMKLQQQHMTAMKAAQDTAQQPASFQKSAEALGTAKRLEAMVQDALNIAPGVQRLVRMAILQAQESSEIAH